MADASYIKLSNRRKDDIRKEVYAQAFDVCHEQLRTYAECIHGRLFSVVWTCRAENRALNDCLHPHTSKEKMEEAFGVAERKLNEERRQAR
eukprot:CAMPEP_0119407312 /NCGR_PEP_ID=MMETSP1335-20130426/1255_1 /TAXON_ID=259385 /ORGANISM="Chrysoculter rhomboideus, Strain RCC1486" /LENGTH=90 /DNA_ID=CAMNT_0007431409 /DNA_START=25 /DNA_END=297 /DNA_ORIENTATION=-